MRPVRTFVIERDGLLREGLKKTLEKPRFQPLRAYCKIEDLGESIAHLVILGTRDLHEASHLVARLRQRSITTRIAVLAEGCSFERAPQELMLAGANAILSRSISCELLLKSLDLVLFDHAVAVYSVDAVKSENSQARVLTTHPSAPAEPHREDVVCSFSDREIAVLSCLEFGGSNKLIARKLGITESTVKVHLKAIMRKLRVNNRTQAAVWAMRQLKGSSQPVLATTNGFDRSHSALVASKKTPYSATY